MDALLPDGQGNMFKLILGKLQRALAAERPELLTLLRKKVRC